MCTLSERGHGGKKSTFNKSVDITVAARRKLWFSEFESTKIQEEVCKPFSGVERFIADIKKAHFNIRFWWILDLVAGKLFHYFCYFLQKEIVLYSAKIHNKSMPIGNEIAHIPYNFPSVTPVDFNHQENEKMVYHN